MHHVNRDFKTPKGVYRFKENEMPDVEVAKRYGERLVSQGVLKIIDYSGSLWSVVWITLVIVINLSLVSSINDRFVQAKNVTILFPHKIRTSTVL